MKYYTWASFQLGSNNHIFLKKKCVHEILYEITHEEKQKWEWEYPKEDLPRVKDLMDERFQGVVFHEKIGHIYFSDATDAMMFKMMIS